MNLVTYLLGAGASANCLPVVSKMGNRIKVVFTIMRTSILKEYNSPGATILIDNDVLAIDNLLDEIEKDFEWLSKACESHSSIDTYAKKLYLSRNEKEYNRLKLVLSFYLTLEQIFTPADLRYDNFWASILESSSNGFPENLRILSWNYDFQLEKSYSEFISEKRLDAVYDTLNISTYKDNSRNVSNKFGIFKLNGSTRFNYNGKGGSDYFFRGFEAGLNKDFYERLIQEYFCFRNNLEEFENHLSFAWEHDYSNIYYQEMSESIRDTTVLVVVGYSFPYFNRKTDRKILKTFMPRLDKVYFQAPENEGENLKERFLAIRDDLHDFHIRRDTSQFAFPNEL